MQPDLMPSNRSNTYAQDPHERHPEDHADTYTNTYTNTYTDTYTQNPPKNYCEHHPESQPETKTDVSPELLTFWLEPELTARLLEHRTASLRRWRALLLTVTTLLAVGSVISFATVFLWVFGMFLLGVSSITLLLAAILHMRLRQRQRFLDRQARALRVVLRERQLELHNARWSLALAYSDISDCNWCTRTTLGIPALCVVTPAFTVMLQGFARSNGLHAALQVLVTGQRQPVQDHAQATLLTGVGALLALAFWQLTFWQRHHPWGLLLPPLLLFATDLYALRLPQYITGLERFRPQRRWYLRPRMVLTLLTIAWSVWLLL